MEKLKQLFYTRSKELGAEIKAFLKEKGQTVIDQVTVDQVIGGMRGIKAMYWETSELDAEEGIRFRGLSINELREKLPTWPGCGEPMPEGLFWLLMTGEIPAEEDVYELSEIWQSKRNLPPQVIKTLEALPPDTHPMTQLTMGIMAMQPESIFAKCYDEGMSRTEYWDATFEDSINLIAKLPTLAAYIYRRTFKNNVHIEADPRLDWSGNFAHQLGFDGHDFKSFLRLYLTIHADHEGGNASAHTTHLVGSTLADPYLSLAAGMNALAGPLHGLANQEVIKWVFDLLDDLGTRQPSKEQIIGYIHKTLQEGKVIPGYGHAVLRQPDPRFIAQMEFAKKYINKSDIIDVVWTLYNVVPGILTNLGKVKNPWPNVDAHSGAILVHYGLIEQNFFTVLFGVSRALGVLAAQTWARALALPLERPKSLNLNSLKQLV